MKKIGVIVSKYHPFIGGTERLAKIITDEILSKTSVVEIITEHNSERAKEDFNYKINEINLLDKNELNNTIHNKNYDLCIFFADLHSIHLNNYDMKCKKNICILNIDERTYQARHMFTNATNNLKKFDKVITYTKDGVANKFLIENDIKNIYIQNFSRDVLATPVEKEFGNKIRSLYVTPDRKFILYPAVFEERKNQYNVLSKLVEQSHLREFNWLFIGPHHEDSYLTKCIQISNQYNLPVKFIKGTNNVKQLDKLYQVCDLVCLTSIAEGLPLTLVEALSANKPWVATPVGGIPSVLGNSNTGIVLEQINFSGVELYDSIKNVLKLTSNNNSRKYWEENFQQSIVLQKYKQLVDEVINDHIQ